MVNLSQTSASSTQGGTDDSGEAEPSWPLTTWQGWHRFATTDPPTPPRPGDPPRSTEERLAYHSTFVTIRTPAIHTLATQVRTLMILGCHQQTTARPSLIVTGPAAAGKRPRSSTSAAPATSPTSARTPHRPDQRTQWYPSRMSWSRPARPRKPSSLNSPATSASPSQPA
ncbi:hypothetical protein ACWCXX_39030 [Streptomyces sp. NPDC001732]